MDGLPGLTLELMDDLFDLVRKFGRIFMEVPLLFVTATVPRTLYVSVTAFLDGHQMFVMNRHDGVVQKTMYTIPFDGERGTAFWDPAVTVEDVKTLIICSDAKVKILHPSGFTASGHRVRIPPQVSELFFKRSVAETFTSPQIAMPIQQPSHLLALRAQFDRPEVLVPFVDSFGCTYLCHVDHLEEVKHRHETMRRICDRRGITTYAQVLAMTPEEIKNFRKEFEAELARRPN